MAIITMLQRAAERLNTETNQGIEVVRAARDEWAKKKEELGERWNVDCEMSDKYEVIQGLFGIWIVC